MNHCAPVTIVIPHFNGVEDLARALDSVVRQSVAVEEIIVIDDCSSPIVVQLVEKLVRTVSSEGFPLRLIKQPENLGPASARNIGWRESGSEYVAFLDADDSWHRDKVRIQYQFMDRNQDFSFTSHRRVTCALPGRVDELVDAKTFTLVQWMISSRASTSTVMVRRDIPERFPAGERYAEDYELWLSLVVRGYRHALLPLELCRAFKPAYGRAGLSARLWKMERGELRALRRGLSFLSHSDLLYPLVATLSVLKYLNRVRLVFSTKYVRTSPGILWETAQHIVRNATHLFK